MLDVRTAKPERQFTLSISGQVQLLPGDADASGSVAGVLTMPGEALLRLLTGCLERRRTPTGVSVTGPLDLDALRSVFAGF